MQLQDALTGTFDGVILHPYREVAAAQQATLVLALGFVPTLTVGSAVIDPGPPTIRLNIFFVTNVSNGVYI